MLNSFLFLTPFLLTLLRSPTIISLDFAPSTANTTTPHPQKTIPGTLYIQNGCQNTINAWIIDQTGVSVAYTLGPSPPGPWGQFSKPVGSYNFTLALSDQVNFEQGSVSNHTEYVHFWSSNGSDAGSNVTYAIDRRTGVPAYVGDANTRVGAWLGPGGQGKNGKSVKRRTDGSAAAPQDICRTCPPAELAGPGARGESVQLCPQFCDLIVGLCVP